MRHNFQGPTVTRVLHIHRFTPGPGKNELGGTMSGMSARGGKPAQENHFLFSEKEGEKKRNKSKSESALSIFRLRFNFLYLFFCV